LESNEVIFIDGAERFSNYTGYSNTVKWDSDHIDKEERTDEGSTITRIVVMDAISMAFESQWTTVNIMRDLNKAHRGFRYILSTDPYTKVSTGNWGCGVFGGDIQLKFIQQWLAASLGEKDLVYHTFGNSEQFSICSNLVQDLEDRRCTVKELYNETIKYANLRAKKFAAQEPLSEQDTLFSHLQLNAARGFCQIS